MVLDSRERRWRSAATGSCVSGRVMRLERMVELTLRVDAGDFAVYSRRRVRVLHRGSLATVIRQEESERVFAKEKGSMTT